MTDQATLTDAERTDAWRKMLALETGFDWGAAEAAHNLSSQPFEVSDDELLPYLEITFDELALDI
jgi:hypothetical protein